jgi:hypothetical protein
MLGFERGRDIKTALDMGISKKLPIWMEDSEYNYKDYFHVWKWALEEKKDIIFPYIVEKRGSKWYNGEKIKVGMEDNNTLLWESVSENYLPAVEACLKVEGLFADEVFTLDLGTHELKETFKRGSQKVHYRATNFGAFVELAMKQAKGNFELQDSLMSYYRKYSKNAI